MPPAPPRPAPLHTPMLYSCLYTLPARLFHPYRSVRHPESCPSFPPLHLCLHILHSRLAPSTSPLIQHAYTVACTPCIPLARLPLPYPLPAPRACTPASPLFARPAFPLFLPCLVVLLPPALPMPTYPAAPLPYPCILPQQAFAMMMYLTLCFCGGFAETL